MKYLIEGAIIGLLYDIAVYLFYLFISRLFDNVNILRYGYVITLLVTVVVLLVFRFKQ